MSADPRSVARGAVLDVHQERLLDDISLAAQLGLRSVRLDVPWALAQPKAGAIDGDVIERVQIAAGAARAAGVEPWLRLLQPAIPHWFDDEGGFTDDRNAAHWWPRWVETAADHLGEVAAGWVPFEAPFAMSRRLMPDDLARQVDVLHTMVVAWRDAWRLLRGVHPVATSLDVAIERPIDNSPDARDEARRRDHLRWGLWLRGFHDGMVRVPGRADRELADFAGSLDVLGLALRKDLETCIIRTADHGLDIPISITFRPTGDTDGDRALDIRATWRVIGELSADLPLHSVTITPFADLPGAPGVVTADRELKDSGDAFVSPD